MNPIENDSVKALLTDVKTISPWQYECLTHLRRMFLSQHEKPSEGIKYGGLVFSCNEQLIGGIFVYKNHISVEFGRGAELKDTRQMLQGKGKFRRHIKINKPDDIQQKYLNEYISAIFKLHVS